MNETLAAFARGTLQRNLPLCNEGEQNLFKRMYADGNINLPINEVINNMPVEKLDWAVEQVRRTLLKKGD